ncbi:MAG: DUF2088 domain-containing protein [Oscillibacter sp.]|nr:DUF2088 domain-containing protein [Oscillibacter sp.]
MQINLPAHSLYGNAPIPLTFPDGWDVQVSSFRGAEEPALTQAEITERVQNPTHTAPIRQAARGCKNAVIIFDDITRATPIGPVAKAVIAELEEAGVPRGNIEFMAAVGGHRAMSREEFVRKLGEEIVDEFRVWSHNPFFNCVYLGKTSQQIPIELNAECVYAGFKVAIGAIFPHVSTGAGGGGKIILPGIASLETIRRWHLTDSGMWLTDSDSRRTVTEAAEMLGLHMKIDVLMNGQGQIARLYAGDCEHNLQDHYDEIQQFFSTVHVPDVDLLLTNNYFKPSEPNCAIVQMGMLETVRPGGDVILAYNSPLGCACHYVWGKWGDSGIGGCMYRKQWRIPEQVNRFFVFTEYPDFGTSSSYHLNEDGNIFARRWEEILEHLGPKDRRVALYPYGDACCFEDKLGSRYRQRS